MTTREEIARAIGVGPAQLDVQRLTARKSPKPMATLPNGPIWNAESIERWITTRRRRLEGPYVSGRQSIGHMVFASNGSRRFSAAFDEGPKGRVNQLSGPTALIRRPAADLLAVRIRHRLLLASPRDKVRAESDTPTGETNGESGRRAA